jgi:hypothetical protein
MGFKRAPLLLWPNKSTANSSPWGNASHQGDCIYKDDQSDRHIYCELSHAQRFFAAAQAFAYWIEDEMGVHTKGVKSP